TVRIDSRTTRHRMPVENLPHALASVYGSRASASLAFRTASLVVDSEILHVGSLRMTPSPREHSPQGLVHGLQVAVKRRGAVHAIDSTTAPELLRAVALHETAHALQRPLDGFVAAGVAGAHVALAAVTEGADRR